jgi:hypothetical protein
MTTNQFGKCYTVFVVRSVIGLYGTSDIKYNRLHLHNNDEISRAHVLILKNGRMTPDIPAGFGWISSQWGYMRPRAWHDDDDDDELMSHTQAAIIYLGVNR